MKRIVVLISGSGSNLQAIIDNINLGLIQAEVVEVISNNENAYGLVRAKNENIDTFVLDHKSFNSRDEYDNALEKRIQINKPDLIVMAGFMRILTPLIPTKYKGKMFWYNGTTWIQGQDKATSNSAPTFDLFDENGNSFTTYTNTTFTGTKLFSYKIGTGAVDPELGFALSYQNVQNTGDIVFNFNLLNDSFTYNLSGVTQTVKTDTSVLRKYTDRTTYTSVTGWKKADNLSKQEVVRQYDTTVKTNDFPVDVYDFSGDLNALTVKVYLNGQRKTELTDYEINRINRIAYVTFTKKITNGDKLVIKTTSEADKNTNGYYEFPSNLESNPQNANINEFTLGEVNDHVQSIVDNVPGFSGTNPGVNNLRDLGLTSKYGTKFLQHSGPMNLALYHMTDKDANIIKALKFAKREYSKFKRNFVKTAEDLGFEGPAILKTMHFILVICLVLQTQLKKNTRSLMQTINFMQ